MWYAVAGAGFVVDAERRPFYVRAMRAVVAAQVASTLVKLVVSRARPLLEELPALTPSISGRSYPSAHASTSFAAARVLAQPLPAGPLYAGAVAMALSRP